MVKVLLLYLLFLHDGGEGGHWTAGEQQGEEQEHEERDVNRQTEVWTDGGRRRRRRESEGEGEVDGDL